jgi:N6-L-threonylcarbamoyladenine synthase
MKNKIILAIETSCDDTSLAIIKDGKILSEYSSSSTKKHKQYGGIIPELAAREHTKAIDNVFRKAIASSKIKKNQLTHIAYTATPGLPGSLHIGKIYAKTLSFLLDIPLIPINHMMGHAFSFAIENKKIIKFPLLSLVISGGNTILYLFKSYDKYEILNQTNDDAIGEALDKIGRVIGFSYPGGISLDNNYNKLKSNLKIINHQKPSCDFTFSGIKTFATNYVNEHKMKNQKYDKIALGSSCLK